jgi:hypothetical protein
MQQRHLQEPTKAGSATPYRLGRQSIPWKALHKAPNGDTAFQPRQAQACALMDAETEGQVLVNGAFDV